jgi:hypothetical protein
VRFLIPLALLFAGPLHADKLPICYNYGCKTLGTVVLNKKQLDEIHRLFLHAGTSAEERSAVSQAMGLLETFSGQQTPIWRDKGENYNDNGVDGRMDCIDHSTNTTTYLRLLERKGWLKFHRVGDRIYRAPIIINPHWTASMLDTTVGKEYAVDTWFFDNGRPAAVLPLKKWRRWWSP